MEHVTLFMSSLTMVLKGRCLPRDSSHVCLEGTILNVIFSSVVHRLNFVDLFKEVRDVGVLNLGTALAVLLIEFAFRDINRSFRPHKFLFSRSRGRNAII